jgi:DNA-binding NarL/FixJ family response regulator
MPHPIRVGIADDHAITRRALRQLIGMQPDMGFAGEAENGREALELVRNCPLDVLVLDLMMPGQGGMDAIRAIRARAPDTRILVFTSSSEKLYALNLIRRGANGFLNKQCEPQQIVDAVRAVAAGRMHVSAQVIDMLAEHGVGQRVGAPHDRLTDRELALMIRFAKGEVSSQIAADLHLSPRSVSTYHSNLLRKLELKTNSELTHYAMTHGLID